ncbi:DUF202 domain-containing protein [Jiangella ureilytica]|uniref:DUF202 domain-containing protein n=1 Tax=Jiangella ureilytica TaxID=2530374 RepID=A0A4R4RMX7_9ACTN|nr:DUF202 domain-containing protein [Jiangella ureilytica]
MQPERTLLAWRRTCLSLALASAVAVRLMAEDMGVAGVLAGRVGLFLGGGTGWSSPCAIVVSSPDCAGIRCGSQPGGSPWRRCRSPRHWWRRAASWSGSAATSDSGRVGPGVHALVQGRDRAPGGAGDGQRRCAGESGGLARRPGRRPRSRGSRTWVVAPRAVVVAGLAAYPAGLSSGPHLERAGGRLERRVTCSHLR